MNLCAASLLVALGLVAFTDVARAHALPPSMSLTVAAAYYRERPAELMRLARALARSRLTEETLTFSITGVDVNEQQQGLVRIDPGLAGPVRVRLDLGDISLSVTSVPGAAAEPRTELLGVRVVDSARYVRREIEGAPSLATLQKLMPPVPVPALALAIGDDRDWDQVLPLGEPVEWIAADPDGGMWRVLGVSTGGGASATPISVWLDAGTLRVRRVESVWTSPKGELSVRVDASPAPVLPVSAWGIEVGGRTPVSEWSELVPPPQRIVEDGLFPAAFFNERDGRPWEGLELRPGAEREHRYALLVLYGPGEGAEAARTIMEGVRGARARIEGDYAKRLASGDRPSAIRVSARPAPCFSSVEFTPEALSAESARWRGEAGTSPLLFTLAPESTLDAIAPGKAAVAVLIGAEMRILGIYEIPQEPGPLAEAIAQRIRRNAWPGWEP